MKKDYWKKEEIAEDYCFICKDGGHLRVCDYKNCLKAYHPGCVNKDPSFLETDECWTCGWHTCNCQKSSTFQCFCCPTSFCCSCMKSAIRTATFVKVRKKTKTKGFCNNCLRVAIMIEEGRNTDSDGEEVDFSNTETYEFLFKDYWEIVKDQEGLTLVDVQAADALLKRGEKNCQRGSDSDKPFEEESISEPDDMGDDCDDGESLFKDLKRKRGRPKTMKTPTKKSKKKRIYNGWGSEELIHFLAAIGKDTKEPLAQVDACEIVKDYIQSKNLFHPDKKRKRIVVADEKLYSLFRKKKLKFHKIFDLLKSHLAEYAELSDDSSFGSEEDEETIFNKKQQRAISDPKIQKSDPTRFRKKILEPSKSSYAAIIVDNIKLVYLKRTLIMELLKNRETFENKVVGCFVRVKNDPKDYYYLLQKVYQLGVVTGIKKSQQVYRVGDTNVDIVLCVSNFSKDIYLSMLSDDDFEEDECADLRQLVRKGLFKQPTVVELESKISSVHEDIMSHWIEREIVKLQKQIDRANQKGWRRELHEYIDRRELLRTPEERMRLVKEIPEVIADTEGNGSDYCEHATEGKAEEIEAAYLENAAERAGSGTEPAYLENAAERKDVDEATTGDNGAVSHVNVAEREQQVNLSRDEDMAAEDAVTYHGRVSERTEEGYEAMATEIAAASDEKIAEGIIEDIGGNEAVTSENVIEYVAKGINGASNMQRTLGLSGEQQSKNSINQVIEIEDEEAPSDKKTSEIPIIIDLEDDENIPAAPTSNGCATSDACEEIVQAATPENRKVVWHYKDPFGTEQGPFPLTSLRFWNEQGYFNEDFKIWRSGQLPKDGILLADALALAFQ